jgi:1-acyl-sn-glycerol-3-phosphate acyltransferase
VSSGLLKSRRFGPFFVTQFLGAFNDNVFKNALIIVIAFEAGTAGGMSPDALVNLAAGLFVLPMFLFSAMGGQVAEKYEKSMLMQRIKLAEIAIMILAGVGFALGSVPFLLCVLFAMGAQSAFFGPVKYAILPVHLAEDELVGGNGLVEMGTFLAILLGTVLGGILIVIEGVGATVVTGVLVVLAVAGFVASRSIPKAEAPVPELKIGWNIAKETWRVLGFTRENPTVFNSVLGISWFWFFGATLLAQLQGFTRDYIGGDAHVVTALLAVFALGIGLGSMLCERLSGKLVEIGLVPFGAIGLSLFTLDLYLASPNELATTSGVGVYAFLGQAANWRIMLDLFGASVFGGFFIVPLYALIQIRSAPERRSRIIAGNNVLNALFMVASAGVAIGLLEAGLSVPDLFLVLALINAAVAIYIFTLVPEFLMRFLVWLLVRTVYRLKIKDIEQIPEEGPAVIVCNHVSFVDALVISAACRRPIRFVMDHRIFALPIIKFVFRVGGAIPIAPAREDEAMMLSAFDTVAQTLDEGGLVGIFPEGKITADGQMNVFKGGIERMVERNPVPVVPLALRGLFGSVFSRADGTAMGKPGRLLSNVRRPIELVASAPVSPAQLVAGDLGAVVEGMRGDRL